MRDQHSALRCQRGNRPLRDREWTIAVAEDNEGDVALVEEALASAGLRFRLLVCTDGEQMSNLLDQIEAGYMASPGLFLLDLNLPRVDGAALLRKLRKGEKTGSIPAIVITSSDSPRDREATRSAGATAYFRKPSDLDEFLRLGELTRDVLTDSAA